MGEHPGPFAYDLRRIGASISDLGGDLPWPEACLLLNEILTEPGSHTTAALAGWTHPVSHEWVLLAQLVDDHRAANSKRKIKPWPRPWPSPGVTRLGAKSKVSDARDVLRRKAGR